jgi:hypothetical protein
MRGAKILTPDPPQSDLTQVNIRLYSAFRIWQISITQSMRDKIVGNLRKERWIFRCLVLRLGRQVQRHAAVGAQQRNGEEAVSQRCRPSRPDYA